MYLAILSSVHSAFSESRVNFPPCSKFSLSSRASHPAARAIFFLFFLGSF